MKLSFSLSSKPSSKPYLKLSQNSTPNEEAEVKEFVTEFDSSKTLANNNLTERVIPPIENEWCPFKQMENLHLPLRSDAPHLQFDLQPPSIADDRIDSNISDGLNLRQSTKADADEQPRSGSAVERVPLQKFRDNLKRLPEDRGFDEFEDVPVEGFAAAMLAGYGWYEGRGIGKNAKEDVEIVPYEKRTIGFAELAAKRVALQKLRDDLKRFPEDRGSDKFKDVPIEGFGAAILAGYRLYKGRGIGKNAKEDVKIVPYEKRTEKESLGFVRDTHVPESKKERVDKVTKLGSMEKGNSLNKLKDLEIRGGNKDSKRNREEGKREFDNRKVKQQRKGSKVFWLRSHIRVRIISKDLRGGKLYLKKGKVVDVFGPKICDIYMDESREIIQGVDQELLETVLPRCGGTVLVLYGKHKGLYGNLLEKDLEQETGVVQDANSQELLNVRLEQIAEYVGDPSDIGY